MEGVLIKVGAFLLIALVYAMVYHTVPRQKPPRRVVLVSAISSAILLEAAKFVFGIYLSQAILIERIYGAYLFAAAIALWIYYVSLKFVLSSQIGRLFWERRKETQ